MLWACGQSHFCAHPGRVALFDMASGLVSHSYLVSSFCGCLQAYGNAALALLLCVGSNTIGIGTIPFLLEAILSSSTDVNLDAVDLLIKLVIGVLVPLAIGKLFLLIPAVQQFTKNHKTLLKLLSNGSLIMVLWQSISRAEAWCHLQLML